MTDFIKTTLQDIEKRRRELEPLVEEYRQLEQAAAALSGVDNGRTRPQPARRRRSGTGTGKRGRPRGSGKRAHQALSLVAARPGITIPELAKEMKIQPNYLYRVLPSLADEGKVQKKDKGWYPAASK